MKKVLKQRLKDVALYVAICMVIIGIVIAMFANGMSWDFFVKRIGFGISTALLFGYFLQGSRTLLRKKSFWFLFTFLFTVHCAIWVAVIAHVEHWKFIWFYPVLIELAGFQLFRNKFFGIGRVGAQGRHSQQ
ncbi:hypothetical protein [Tunturibacter empetritectus]|uniref:Membrane protein n=1 Tax=Tunturiibacter lichenicola TaxID=2051959 RepID=A0A7W8J5A1_9BACT|nr:hypothetical protein [Edaphobacter lichenicola]MBB5342806.1 putative membrane protein [Edaphobacter lichenicola]